MDGILVEVVAHFLNINENHYQFNTSLSYRLAYFQKFMIINIIITSIKEIFWKR